MTLNDHSKTHCVQIATITQPSALALSYRAIAWLCAIPARLLRHIEENRITLNLNDHKGSLADGGECMANVTAGDEEGRAVRLTAWVEGRVQGVGFRYWVMRKATELDLRGSATNLPDGSVEVVAEGSEDACRGLLAALGSGAGPGRVTRVTQRWGAPRGDLSGFVAR